MYKKIIIILFFLFQNLNCFEFEVEVERPSLKRNYKYKKNPFYRDRHYKAKIVEAICSHVKFLDGMLTCSKDFNKVFTISGMSIDLEEVKNVNLGYKNAIKNNRNSTFMKSILEDPKAYNYLIDLYSNVDRTIVYSSEITKGLTRYIEEMISYYKKIIRVILKNKFIENYF